MRSTSSAVCFLLMAMIPASEAVAQAPVSQAWAARIEGPTNTPIQVSRMDVGPSGDVYLTGLIGKDILITRRSPGGVLVWERHYELPALWPGFGSPLPFGIVAHGTNVYVAGRIWGTNGYELPDFLTLKYRDDGELEWAVRSDSGLMNGGTAIAVDGEGNLLVLGQSVSTNIVEWSNGHFDIVVLKHGPAGNVLWTYHYAHPQHGLDSPVEMRVDPAGNIHVAGTSVGEDDDGRSAITFKLDPDGHVLWTAEESWGSAITNRYGVTAQSLDVDSAGNVVTVGNERPYCVTWKYDANGNRQWVARYRTDEATMSAYDVRVDASGEIIVAARLSSSLQANDTLLIKYAPDGQQIWATRISRPPTVAHLTALDLDSDGNSYLAMSPASDVITVKVSPAGAQLWSVTNFSPSSDLAEFLDVTPSGDIFVAGRSTNSSQTFVSLVKYTQQPVTGLATAVVTPALQVVDRGANVVFTAETTGPGPVQYRWRWNGLPISSTGPTLSLPNVQALGNSADYSVIIYNAAGATVSPEARLSVRVPPQQVVITPTQTVAHLGTETRFTATVTVPGNDFLTLQWRHNGTNIPGAINDILLLTNLNAGMSGSYDIVASTIGGTATSSAAELRISQTVQQLQTTSYWSANWNWNYAPILRVLPNGESLLAGSTNLTDAYNIVLEKRAANGEVLWTTRFGSHPEFVDALPFQLILDGSGNIYIAGYVRCCGGVLAVLKYNPDGQLLWSRTNHGGPSAFVVDAQGNSVIAHGSGFTRYNHAGDLQWTFPYPSATNEYMGERVAVAVNDSGDTYVGITVGRRDGTGVRVELRKFDSTGALLWMVPYAQMYRYYGVHALAVDGAGDVIVAGFGSPQAGDRWYLRQMFVQKYSPGGQKLWETRLWDFFGREHGHGESTIKMAVGAGNEITLLPTIDYDSSYLWGEAPEVNRLRPDGQVRYRIWDPDLLIYINEPLALDNFGNAYVSGNGVGAVVAKYDADGNRQWLANFDQGVMQPRYGLGVGVDAAGDVRLLVKHTLDYLSDYTLIHYRQRDPASVFRRLQLIADPGGTFHLATASPDPFRIEASTDLRTWDLLSEAETQQLLQPGAISFADAPKHFFRVVFTE